MKLTLITKSLRTGTFGELTYQGEILCVTVERQFENNMPNISCIPAGTYSLKKHISPKFGACFALENPNVGVTVEGPSQRTHCLMHVANWPEQLSGCIAPGMSFHPTQWGVANSRDALDMLMEQLPDKSVLEIIRL
ncbi:DUF5675 family protein [Shewanella sp. D64]|uniref:DUF5675 family protein n=1 Tax=unclassified Shewanella TaxID=196818 RepID=UPI0022BA22AC|nr:MULTISPECIES: DUF5675 family protein [unclassified Shewanella]MEC4729010.1 DUF5675 family protein [Shewanella sp. D64]MEC4740036.1 DUF5675 family protein [Shewanella sp. E94]WBJ94391.1 DUF5675 family protein [Shewanella sp. MTB7]